ncbi:MAG TPA: response regulator [Pseudomonadales bacterium]|nr:response regulator [Pseudomonadales bacterium]
MVASAQVHCKLPIQRKLLLSMFLLALLPVTIVGVLAYVKAREMLVEETSDKLVAVAQLASMQLDHTIRYAEENVRVWSESKLFQEIAKGYGDPNITKTLYDYQASYGLYTTLVVANPQGKIIAAGDTDLVGRDVSQADWFVKTVATRQMQTGQLRFDSILGGYGVPLSAPIFDPVNHELIGIISAGFDWNILLQYINSIKVVAGGQSNAGYALLVDAEGFVIGAPAFILHGDDQSAVSEFYRVSDKRIDDSVELKDDTPYQFSRFDKNLYLVAHSTDSNFQELNTLGWRLIIYRDAADALSSLNDLRNKIVGLSLLFIAAIFIASVMIASRLAEPIYRLTEWVKRVAANNLNETLAYRSNDELGELAAAFDRVRMDLKNYIQNLHQANSRFLSLMNSVEGVVWEVSLTPQFHYSFVSNQIESVLGYSAEDWMRYPDIWMKAIDPDYREAGRKAILAALKSGNSQVVELRMVQRSSKKIWAKVFISAVFANGRCTGLRGVAVDISDLKEASEKMERARDLALKTAQAKTQFLGMMSHEIRTPLNGLLGMLDAVRDSEMLPAQREKLQLAWESGESLLQLVNDIMDFSRLEEGNLKIEKTRFNIRETLDHVIAAYAAAASEKHLDLGVVCERHLPSLVETDAVRIRQLLLKLLSNAIKFTPHGEVLVWAELLDNNRLYVEVKDSGVGISTEQQAQLFNPFVQGDNSTTRRYGGTGLGLALAKRIVDALGGNLSVKSIPGMGSSFYFEIPVQVPEQQPDTVPIIASAEQGKTPHAILVGDVPATRLVLHSQFSAAGVQLDWIPKVRDRLIDLEAAFQRRTYSWVFVADLAEDERDALSQLRQVYPDCRFIQIAALSLFRPDSDMPCLYTPVRVAQLREILANEKKPGEELAGGINVSATENRNVLLVDDNAVNQRVAKAYLAKLGLEVDIAENGLEALEAIARKEYQLVFMDCQMPVMDGFEATRRIRAQETDARRLPIVALTANVMEGDKEKCLESGMDDYLPKPVRKELLREMVDRWMPGGGLSATLH